MNESSKKRWALRFDLWRRSGQQLGPMVSGLGRLLSMRAAFEIKSPLAYWSMVATDALELAVYLARKHADIEALIRADVAEPSEAPPFRDGGGAK